MFHREGQEVQVGEVTRTENLVVVKTIGIAERYRVDPEHMIRRGDRVGDASRDLGDPEVTGIVRMREDAEARVLRQRTRRPTR